MNDMAELDEVRRLREIIKELEKKLEEAEEKNVKLYELLSKKEDLV